jgi:hypothetical protein
MAFLSHHKNEHNTFLHFTEDDRNEEEKTRRQQTDFCADGIVSYCYIIGLCMQLVAAKKGKKKPKK